MLVCEGISKKYGQKVALDNISLSLEPHKIYGLIGRNGAGKTTLLGILSGQNQSTGGKVYYDDEAVWENQKALNNICFSREINTTILFGSDTRKVKTLLKIASIMFPYWDKAYAEKLVSEFEIDVKKGLNKLSKGMLSSITIIIALASKSKITFLDEPTSGLDVFMRDKFYALLLDEFINSDRTFIVSTHIIDEAASVLENVIIIENGKIIKNENTEELLSKHRLVSGKDSDIDEFCKKYKVLHSESFGKSKTVCVLVKNENEFKQDILNFDFDISKPSLQKLFTKLL